MTYSLSMARKADQRGSFFLGTSELRAAMRSEDNEDGKGGTLAREIRERDLSVETKLFSEVAEEVLERRFKLTSLLFLLWKVLRGFCKRERR